MHQKAPPWPDTVLWAGCPRPCLQSCLRLRLQLCLRPCLQPHLHLRPQPHLRPHLRLRRSRRSIQKHPLRRFWPSGVSSESRTRSGLTCLLLRYLVFLGPPTTVDILYKTFPENSGMLCGEGSCGAAPTCARAESHAPYVLEAARFVFSYPVLYMLLKKHAQ